MATTMRVERRTDLTTTYRVERDGRYCEFTRWGDDDRVSSFGGSIWPGEMPDLFESRPGSAAFPVQVVLTASGRSAAARAETRSLRPIFTEDK